MKKIRTLKANEIEVRTAMVKDGKASQLLYIDSRAATDLLDETYGMVYASDVNKLNLEFSKDLVDIRLSKRGSVHWLLIFFQKKSLAIAGLSLNSCNLTEI